MKKHLLLPTLIILLLIALVPARGVSKTSALNQADSLTAYTGKFQMKQGAQVINAEVYVENGKLIAKESTTEVLTLDHVSGDDFIISDRNLHIKFIRNEQNKVTQIAVNGTVAWNRVSDDTVIAGKSQPAAPADYIGKYSATANGSAMFIEISEKDGQLWATQLWDGATSPIDYSSGDEFMLRALNLPLKFTRGSDKKVSSLDVSGDVFTKAKN